MWNPVDKVKGDWSNTKSFWGKIAVILFYVFVWLLIVVQVYQYFVPNSTGPCVTKNMKHDDAVWTVYLLREFAWYPLGLLLYAQYLGIQMFNLFMVTIFTVGSMTMLHSLGADSFDDSACYDRVLQQWPLALIAWPIAFLVLAFVDAHVVGRGVTSTSTGENQPLV